MAGPKQPPFLWDSVVRGVRFFYLLWGGMLLSTHAIWDRIKLPAELWQWPDLARILIGPWGRGLALGLGLTMALAALLEVWELVDLMLARLLQDTEQDR